MTYPASHSPVSQQGGGQDGGGQSVTAPSLQSPGAAKQKNVKEGSGKMNTVSLRVEAISTWSVCLVFLFFLGV